MALVLGTALVVPSTSHATHLEAKMYGVDNWNLDCPGNSLNWSAQVDRWYDEIDDHGWYSRDGRFVDTAMDRDPFCDATQASPNCTDSSRLDDADAAMIFMHGSDSGDHWRGALRDSGGATVNDCWIDAPDASNDFGKGAELYAGDTDLEFLHFSSCNSMDDDNLTNAWRLFRDPSASTNAGLRLHQADGFHGFMWIGSSLRSDYEDFADDAFSVSIRESWMDNMYRTNMGDNNADQCPVAYAVGTNAADCFNRLDNERYNNIFSDPTSIGYYCYYFYDGCDPDGDGPFVDPNGN
ncbi:hypothetical protein KGQ64_07050 [bacterium]|nr:hypothetical protein [bacterium]